MTDTIDNREIKAGSRWEDRDPRQGNRVIRIIEIPTLSRKGLYEVEVAELNPHTVGQRRRIKASTLRAGFTLISH